MSLKKRKKDLKISAQEFCLQEIHQNETENPATHLCGFTDEVESPHQSANGHLEGVAFAVIFDDAVERMHDEQLLKD